MNGIIYDMSPAPNFTHGIVNNNINTIIKNGLKNSLCCGSYSGVPKFIVETFSPSTALRNKTSKKDAYETAGVEEYWIVSPGGYIEIY